MADFILATFGDEEIKTGSLTDLLRNMGFYRSRMGMGLFFYLKRKPLDSSIRKVELYDGLNAWLLRLPFSAASLKSYNLCSLDRYLRKVLAKTGAESCILPSGTFHGTILEHFTLKTSLSGILFKALLLSVLHGIYSKPGKSIADLDIVIIPGDDPGELAVIVRMLEPEIKYITIAAPAGAESLEDRLAEISEESGLSIGVNGDCKSVFRHADLVINLACASPLSKYRLPAKTLVLNLNDSCRLKTRGDNTVINGVEYELPEMIMDTLGKETLGCFGGSEVADIVLTHKLDIPEGISYSEGIGHLLRREFKNGGFRISGYTGMRGALKPDGILERCQV